MNNLQYTMLHNDELKSFYIHYITKHNNYKYDSKIIEARKK